MGLKKIFSLFLILSISLILSCGENTRTRPKSPESHINILERSVVALVKDDSLFCSGVLIAPRKILTASHCAQYPFINNSDPDIIKAAKLYGKIRAIGQEVKYSTKSQISLHNLDDQINSTSKSTVVKLDPISDIAILKTEKKHANYININHSKLYRGQKIFNIGHPLGLTYTYSEGYIVYPDRKASLNPFFKKKNMKFIQADLLTDGGSSGSPVFDSNGKLVGIISGHINHYSIISHRDNIVKLMNK